MTALQQSIAERQLMLLHDIEQGIPLYTAAATHGWSPAEIDRELKSNQSLRHQIESAGAIADEAVEAVLYEKALKGNMSAITMWLHNRRPHRWADRRSVTVQGGVSVDVGEIQTVQAGIMAAIRQGGVDVIRSLQAPSSAVIDVPSAEVTDDT